MKLHKTKSGYYYKEYKSGKKKRISKKEFMKHKEYKNGKECSYHWQSMGRRR